MARIVRYDGRDFPIIERPTYGETAWAERQAGVKLSQMGDVEETLLNCMISLKRAGIHLQWGDMMAAELGTFEVVESDDARPDGDLDAKPEAAPDPTPRARRVTRRDDEPLAAG